MKRLSADEVEAALLTLPGWRGSVDGIECWYSRATFEAAVHFVEEVAAVAEAASHHPDLDIRYNRVRVFLVTHDAGGVTDRDVAVARAIEHAARE